MKNRSFGKIISSGLVMTVVALVLSSGAAALENEHLNTTEGPHDIHVLHEEDCQMTEHVNEKTHDNNAINSHDYHNNLCNISIDIKNVVNTDPHVHHIEGEHPVHSNSDTHHTNHEHPTHSHSNHKHIYNRVIVKFLEMLQPLRHILDLMNNLTGMSG